MDRRSTGESWACRGTQELDADMADALVGEGGVLPGESLPELQGFGNKCVAGVMEVITNEKIQAKPKEKNKPKDPPQPDQVREKGVLEKATEFADKVLKISTEARRLGLALQGQRISKTLEGEMMQTHEVTELCYQRYKKLILKKCASQKLYNDAAKDANARLSKWETRSQLAQTMIRAVNKKPKKPAEARPSPRRRQAQARKLER